MPAKLPPPPVLGESLPQPPAPEVVAFLARRRSTSALALVEPGPTPAELDVLIRVASRVPDHGKLAPWRFVLLEGTDKAAYAARLEALATERGDARGATKLAKLKAPPMAIAVVSRPAPAEIPEWEQLLSAGAVCTTLLYAAQSMGYGANWITDWYAYDSDACAALGLSTEERVAGFIMLGTAQEAPLERERPDPAPLISRWRP